MKPQHSIDVMDARRRMMRTVISLENTMHKLHRELYESYRGKDLDYDTEAFDKAMCRLGSALVDFTVVASTIGDPRNK
jgi:hypothetical protein